MALKSASEDIRVEYESICSAFNQFASLRFTLAGLYITGVGVLVAADQVPRARLYLIVALTVCLWIVELRTRGLLENLIRRGSQIEIGEWGHSEEQGQPKPFMTNLRNQDSKDINLLFWRVSLPVTHSLGLDFLFSSILIYSLIQLIVS